MATFANFSELQAHYQPLLAAQWHAVAQQSQNRLADTVTIKPLSGAETHIDQILPTEMTPKTGRMAPTVLGEMDYNKRFIYAQEFEGAKGFDEFDAAKFTSQSLPLMETLNEFSKANHRKAEQIIIESIQGTAFEGAVTPTAVNLPASQVIDLDLARTGSPTNIGLTYTKIARLRRLAMENEVFGQGVEDGSEQLCIATTASGLEDLFHDVYANNKDYVTAVGKLRDGEVDTFLGVRFVRTEQLTKRDIGGGVMVADNLAWIRSGVCFGYRDNYTSDIAQRKDLSNATQIRVTSAMGGSRLEESKVWKLPCLITA
tara:strand:+ start:6347 stop:7291 length:945 start_codon:yes stop_codon:yes gene_type:complete